MDPIIKAVWQLIIQAASVNESVETGRQDTIARDATKKSMPYVSKKPIEFNFNVFLMF